MDVMRWIKIINDIDLGDVNFSKSDGLIEAIEARRILVELAKKSVPKKMVLGNDNGNPRRCCASCGCFPSPLANYCKTCGQALDWDV